MIYLTQAFFWLVPLTVIVGFLVSLFMYLHAKKKNKRAPGSYSENSIKNRGFALAVFSFIAGAILVAVLALVILLYTAVAYM